MQVRSLWSSVRVCAVFSKLHFAKRRIKSTKIGIAVGYFPCLSAPYLQVAIGRYYLELWFGKDSYKTDN